MAVLSLLLAIPAAFALLAVAYVANNSWRHFRYIAEPSHHERIAAWGLFALSVIAVSAAGLLLGWVISPIM